MLIDFDQAELLEPRRALDPVVPNKRLWRAEGTGETTADKRKKLGDVRIQKDIIEAEGIFERAAGLRRIFSAGLPSAFEG